MADIAHVVEFKTDNSSGSYADFTVDMNRVPLEFHDNERYEMAVLNGYLRFNTPNISASLLNNGLQIDTPQPATYVTNLADGRYSLFDINAFFDRHALSNGYSTNGITLFGDPATGKISMQIDTGFTFTPSAGLAQILGFAPGAYTAGFYDAPNEPNLDEGIMYVNVVCDVIERNLIPSNGSLLTNDGILETLQYNGLGHSVLSLHSDILTWRPIRQHSGHIRNMRFRLLDQDGNLLRMEEPVYFIVGLRIIK